jgi:hypothetical protein
LVGLGFELSFPLAKQVFYCLSHSSKSCFSYFWDRVSFYAWARLDYDTPFCASHTGVSHHT